MANLHATFSGSIPEHYDRYLGPAWFDRFGAELARRVPADPDGDLLEIACGTGLVTRRLRERLHPSRRMVATDISKAMLDYARAQLAGVKGIDWREADAAKLPFADREFAAVACSFGVMFVPDRKAAFSEARRVLKVGGSFVFSVWDRIEENPCALAYAEEVEAMAPGNPEIRFRLPWDMHDEAGLRALLAGSRFEAMRMEKKRFPIDGTDARTIATGQTRGSPRGALLEKAGLSLEDAIERVTRRLEKLGGADNFRSHAQAIYVEARAV